MTSAAASSADLAPEHRERIDKALLDFGSQPGPLLQVLHEVQRALRFIPPAAIPLIAQALNLSRAEVYGVVSFYHYFRDTPPGRHLIQVCQAEACRSMHGEDLSRHIEQRLGVRMRQTTPDRRFTLEPVYCLGNCACSPAVMIDGELHGRVAPTAFDALLDRLPPT